MSINFSNVIRERKVSVFSLLAVLILFIHSGIYAQSPGSAVTGVVKDSRGEVVIGASIIIGGTYTGVATGTDGSFRINVPDSRKDVLIVSGLGYETREIPVHNRTRLEVVLDDLVNELEEIQVVAYGVQKKETLTGAISSVNTESLLRSPNASVSNTLAGQISGVSSVTTSGQPGVDDTKIYIRGMGSLSESLSQPLIMVDGVERSFSQLDPNEIESVTVLKDASATAVFGVRGANGAILVTTRRGSKGDAKISVSSSVGFQAPTRTLKMADSHTFALRMNEMMENDGNQSPFSQYDLDRFMLGDDPIMYPNTDWRKYIMKKASVQTQHNINISGGTDRVRYFVSMGYLYQDGLLKDFAGQNYDGNFKYDRYNYRSNLDIDITKSTLLKVGIGGVVGASRQPLVGDGSNLWNVLNWSQPMSSPGIVDGKLILVNESRYDGGFIVDYKNNALSKIYGAGYRENVSNTMNLDLALTQKLDFITKGLSFDVKGAYNTSYTHVKSRQGEIEKYLVYYKSEVDGSGLNIGDNGFDNTYAYKTIGQNKKLEYSEWDNRSRDWYMEFALRYARKFGDHNVTALAMYNADKVYYPSYLPAISTGYLGFVGRVTYDFKSKYLAEFNVGYNGSENFAEGQRFGVFPAGSLGYIISQESFMQNQNLIQFLKIRASVGLVGNDTVNGSNNRFLYTPNSYQTASYSQYDGSIGHKYGYNFGPDGSSALQYFGAYESRIGNPNLTWETALKWNYGIDLHMFDNRLKVTFDYFTEKRKDILVTRSTVPGITGLTSSILPVVNLGKVNNHGYEVQVRWSDRVKNFGYWADFNISYAKNKIIYQDEIDRNEPYMWRTGHQVGTVFGREAEGFYREDDFDAFGNLNQGLPVPSGTVRSGDIKFKDLNNDGLINTDDVMNIGYPTRPNYIFGLNYGVDYKGFFLTMNWTGATQRSLVLSNEFRNPFNGGQRALMQFQADNRWTPETAETAEYPRLSASSYAHNGETSTVWVKNGNYLKLKTLTFGYNFTERKFLTKLGISQLGLKFSGYNLLTFDNFNIMDPECNPSQSDSYPIIKIFNFGVNVTF